MKLLCSRLLATSCLLLAMTAAHGSSRPRYGGTARILLQHKVSSLDPLADEDYPEERDRLAALAFETLTEIDAQGRLRPRLASWWQSDSGHRFWQFRLRFAKFHDDTAVTAADVIASLNKVEPAWRCTTVDRQNVTIETPTPVVHLPELLALEKFAILKREPDGTLVGTGAYRLREWQPGEHALFAANEDYWGGRPYPDAIEFQMTNSLRDQLLQRQLGPYAAAEINLDALRVLDPGVQNVFMSRPSDLLVIMFLQPDAAGVAGRSRRKAIDPRLREALAASLNRPAVSALLQRRAVPAWGLLPQWLTGYEFLLNNSDSGANANAPDTDRARRLAASAGGISTPISLAYDFSDPTAKLVAERIQVDAGQVGIQVRPYGESHISSKTAQASMNADAVLLRLPLPSLEPDVALAVTGASLGLDAQTTSAALGAGRPEDQLAIERKAFEGFRLIPVARLPQAVWVNGSAHNWLLLPNGVWDLEQLWVEGAR
jgi:ABC-type transport system substrate-binding protein